MRKQTKLAVILGAAAVMTFGACMTSFAATGWVDEDGSWYYYDSNGDAVTEVWKKGADGKSYYLGEDGEMLVDEWVDGDSRYYVNSLGARVTNEWRYMFGYDDDDAEEESWFWFDGNGKMAVTKKTIKSKVYYFDSDGKMLTGWVDKNNSTSLDEQAVTADAIYCTDDGDRVVGWLQTYAPDDTEEEDLYWYHFSGTGAIRIDKKQTINSKSYVFDNEGKMLSGWVYSSTTDKIDDFTQVDDESPASMLPGYTSAGATVPDTTIENYFYCGKSSDGAVKKSTWIHTVEPGADSEDSDEDLYWYYLAKDGNAYAAGITEAGVTAIKVKDAGLKTYKNAAYEIFIKKINSKYYGFKDNGQMVDSLVYISANLEDFDLGVYYFGKSSDGSMKTGSVSVSDDDGDSFSYYFATKTNDDYTKGQGITGIQASKLYADGLLVKAAGDTKYQIMDVLGNLFIVNESGKIMTSTSTTYTADNGKKYKNVTKAAVGYGYEINDVTGTTVYDVTDPLLFPSPIKTVAEMDMMP